MAVGTALHPPSREHVFHVFPSFGIGGVPLRMVRIINHLGKRFQHTLIALDGNCEAATGIASDIDVNLWPAPCSKRDVLRTVAGSTQVLRRLRPDLLLTYNWGAIEWAMAARLSRVSRHIHLEAGFGRGESDSQIPRRVWFRRLALAGCELIVVPSRRLEALARGVWRFPPARVAYVPNGVDAARFSRLVRDALPGFIRRPEELVIGTVAPLRPEKNVGRLIRVFASLPASRPVRLVVAGDGTERGALERLTVELGVADRVIFAGQIAPETVLGTFDIFALSSDTEQMPNALLEAMAASCPIAAVDVGDVKDIVCEGNREFIVPRDNTQAFALAISRLLEGPAKRAELGRSNRERVVAEFSQERMFAAYSIVFGPASVGEA
jgi:glycosyltransferase involved in cell wall biosynthesis